MAPKRSYVAAAALLTLPLLTGCGKSDKKASPTTTTTKASAGPSTAAGGSDSGSGGDAIEIKGFAFKPSALKVSAGTKVTWTNDDSADHTTTADKGDPASFDSKHLSKGKSLSFTFAKKGTYKYFCDIHNYMQGTVEVS